MITPAYHRVRNQVTTGHIGPSNVARRGTACGPAAGAVRYRRLDGVAGCILSVAGRFPLFETAGAHKAVERGGKVGTVIVEPQR